MANFAAADLDSLVRIVKRKLKKIHYRPHLIDGCLAAAGLTTEPVELPTGVSEGGSVSSSRGRCLTIRRVRR
jgi:hypothetical protein